MQTVVCPAFMGGRRDSQRRSPLWETRPFFFLRLLRPAAPPVGGHAEVPSGEGERFLQTVFQVSRRAARATG